MLVVLGADLQRANRTEQEDALERAASREGRSGSQASVYFLGRRLEVRGGLHATAPFPFLGRKEKYQSRQRGTAATSERGSIPRNGRGGTLEISSSSSADSRVGSPGGGQAHHRRRRGGGDNSHGCGRARCSEAGAWRAGTKC